ncbi:MAG: hypothetical protein L0I76_28485 [Pseudonocardia sp.]|nr:hypothetical protein [Pseudonocardia sp.]
MNQAWDALASARDALTQLVNTALLAGRRGEYGRADRIVTVLHRHGLDGTLALLYGMCDVVVHTNARAAGLVIEPSPVPVPIAVRSEWLRLDGTPVEQRDPAHAWCGEFLVARAAVDLTRCRELVDHPPPGGLLHAMFQLTVIAARTVNMIEGQPR